MSIKSLLMPAISQRLLSVRRLQANRAKAERRRLTGGKPHQVHYFHQTDDPYSALVVFCLSDLLDRYAVELLTHVVGAPPDAAAPERDKLIAYSRKDAQLLANHYGLKFNDYGRQPSPEAIRQANRRLVAAIADGNFPEIAPQVTEQLWREPSLVNLTTTAAIKTTATTTTTTTIAAKTSVTDTEIAAHILESNALRVQLGHYLGGMFHYAGEWYWGLDRLHYLERRLQDLQCRRRSFDDLMFAPDIDLQNPVTVVDPTSIDFFVSLRSPYSAIVTPRLLELARLTGATVRLRYVLPMVMRGLPVPPAKSRYISLDAMREAGRRGVDFGRINDPVGRPTERGMALLALAERHGKGQDFLKSFMHGVWAEGIDAGSDRGLRRILERAGIDWQEAPAALQDQTWRQTAEANRAEMFSLGLWGVPSFRVGDTAVWGQDRLWAVEQAVIGASTTTRQ